MLRGRGKELREGVHYLNPAFSTGARLFQELTRDEALLEDFLVDSATLVNTLASRREDLTGVVRQPQLDVRRARAPAVTPSPSRSSGSRRSCAARTPPS